MVLVATPIGHLGDITARALEALRQADAVYAEDTRHTLKLFRHYGIERPLFSCHEHNEAARAPEVVARVRAGETVALVSDAGTPAVSDPGRRIVAAVVEAGLPVTICPGPSAALAALAVSGFPPVPFAFLGFPPRKAAERQALLRAWRERGATLVLFESPLRLAGLFEDVAAVFGGDHPVVVARELTKVHEEILRGAAAELSARFRAAPARGECTVVVAPATVGASAGRRLGEREPAQAAARAWKAELACRLGRGEPPAQAAAEVARAFGLRRADVYREAVRLRKSSPEKR
ncbi:MAG: 16S rRNA (cytidine(1402)-2'-O)-methyltransferase [Firmicutes bacterium]|nr:16S rRNA (cytidine(1402)-2'-O)-methyltransferase [Bacillota bacterium]